MNESKIQLAADVLSERARLKKGGECVRYAAIVIQALEDAGYRVVKQEQVGRGGTVVSDYAPVFYAVANLEDADTAGLSGGDVLWRDLP